METFDAPRGTRDFLPDRMAVRNHVERVVRNTFETFGFQHIQTPTFEQFDLLAARSGEEIKESMFTFASDAGRYALRPELTSAVCRIIASGKLDSTPGPHKLYYFGPCFRYCRPQEGRYREFFQAGVELIGSIDPLADAETIALAQQLLVNLGVTDSRLKVGNVGIFRKLLDERAPENPMQREEWESHVLHDLDRLMGITAKCKLLSTHGSLSDTDKEFLLREVNSLASLQNEVQYDGPQKLSKVDSLSDDQAKQLLSTLPETAKETFRASWLHEDLIQAEAAELILKVAQTRGTVDEVKTSATQLLKGTAGEAALDDLWHVCDLLQQYGVNDFEVVLGTVRNLDFYTGTVFEIDSAHLGSHRQLCGGGRYDTLVEDFGGPATPATGMAFSFDRLTSVFEKVQKDAGKSVCTAAIQALVVPQNKQTKATAIQVATKLREAGVQVGIDLKERSQDELKDYATNGPKPRCAVVIGDENADQLRLIDFNSNTDKQISAASVVDEVSALLKN